MQVMYDMIDALCELSCPILTIANKHYTTSANYTSYIDFIKPDELGHNAVMRGFDLTNRPFFVVKATLIFENGFILPTFSTFFQRYSDMPSLWHCCGQHGRLLMDTHGSGMNLAQFDLLHTLIIKRTVNLPANVTNLRFKLPYIYTSKPVKITLDYVHPPNKRFVY
jgi:hypothetical protein